MARALYREWFVKFRFPGRGHSTLIDSPAGPRPEGWSVRSLADLVEGQYGYTESASEKCVGPKFLRGMDINKRSFIDWASVPFCPVSNENHERFRLRVGDVVVIRMADPGKVGIVEVDTDAVFASYLIRLSTKSNLITPYYLFYFLLSDRYQDYITGASTGTTRKSASAPVVTGIECVLPPEPLMADFEHQVTPIRELLNSLVARNAVLRSARDLLLPKLISGELDVSRLPPEAPAEAVV